MLLICYLITTQLFFKRYYVSGSFLPYGVLEPSEIFLNVSYINHHSVNYFVFCILVISNEHYSA